MGYGNTLTHPPHMGWVFWNKCSERGTEIGGIIPPLGKYTCDRGMCSEIPRGYTFPHL